MINSCIIRICSIITHSGSRVTPFTACSLSQTTVSQPNLQKPKHSKTVRAGSPAGLQSVSAVVSEGIWGQVLQVFNLNAKIRAHTASGNCQENMLALYLLMKISVIRTINIFFLLQILPFRFFFFFCHSHFYKETKKYL